MPDRHSPQSFIVTPHPLARLQGDRVTFREGRLLALAIHLVAEAFH